MTQLRSYRYQIANVNGDLLDITDPRYRLEDLPDVNNQYTLQPKQNQDGAVLLGDGKVTDRKITLKFDYASGTGSRADRIDATYDLLNNLGGYFRTQDMPYYCTNLERNVRTKIFGRFGPQHAAGAQFRLLKDSMIQLDMLDSDWEDSTATVQTAALDSGEMITLSPSLAFYSSDVFPVITITGTAGSPTVFAVETGRIVSAVFVPFRAMLFSEPEFGLADVISIDCAGTGKVYFNGQEKFEIFTRGYPVKFDRYNQVLRFSAQSGTGDVSASISYRKRSRYG